MSSSPTCAASRSPSSSWSEVSGVSGPKRSPSSSWSDVAGPITPPKPGDGVTEADAIFAVCRDVLVILDRENTIMRVSSRFEREFTLARGSALGRKLLEVLPTFKDIEDPFATFRAAQSGHARLCRVGKVPYIASGALATCDGEPRVVVAFAALQSTTQAPAAEYLLPGGAQPAFPPLPGPEVPLLGAAAALQRTTDASLAAGAITAPKVH